MRFVANACIRDTCVIQKINSPYRNRTCQPGFGNPDPLPSDGEQFSESGRQESNLLRRVPKTRGQPMAHTLKSQSRRPELNQLHRGFNAVLYQLSYTGIRNSTWPCLNTAVPAVGVEPTTIRLKGGYSTIELHQLVQNQETEANLVFFCLAPVS